jgi:hypothetical protein
VTTKHPCSFTFSFNCTGFFLGIWSTFPLSYPSRQILHNPSKRSQPCIHGIHSILASVSHASRFTHQGHHAGPLVYLYPYIIPVHYLHVLYTIHTLLVWLSGFLIGSSSVHWTHALLIILAHTFSSRDHRRWPRSELKGASHFAILGFSLQGLCFPWLPKSENPKDQG